MFLLSIIMNYYFDILHFIYHVWQVWQPLIVINWRKRKRDYFWKIVNNWRKRKRGYFWKIFHSFLPPLQKKPMDYKETSLKNNNSCFFYLSRLASMAVINRD